MSSRTGFAATSSTGVRSETVRSANLSMLLRELHFRGAASRSELVSRTGLTRSSVGALIGELVKLGLVVEMPAASDGSRGRPSPVAIVRSAENVAIAVDVSVDSIGVAAVGLGGVVLTVERIERARDRVSVDATIADIVATVGMVRARLAQQYRILGIGVAVVGLVQRSDNSVAIAPNLGWRDVRFGDRLGAALGHAAPVCVANDADVAALAEIHRGVAVGVDDVLYVWGEVGVGGGLISKGEMITGASGFAGEIGHLPVNPLGRACQCGSRGCWETEVGEGALLQRAGRSRDGGREAVDALLDDALGGVALAVAALNEEATWLGFGLAGLINVLNPSMVVLGGLFDAVYPFVEGRLLDEIKRRALASSFANLVIVRTALGEDALLLGAGELAFEQVLADPLGAIRALTGSAL